MEGPSRYSAFTLCESTPRTDLWSADEGRGPAFTVPTQLDYVTPSIRDTSHHPR